MFSTSSETSISTTYLDISSNDGSLTNVSKSDDSSTDSEKNEAVSKEEKVREEYKSYPGKGFEYLLY